MTENLNNEEQQTAQETAVPCEVNPEHARVTPNLNLQMTWVEEQKMFSMVYRDGETAVFQIMMTPASFEMLAMDMVKTVKNYNLYQAQQYQKMMDENAKTQNQVDNAETPIIGAETAPDQPENPVCESTQGTDS